MVGRVNRVHLHAIESVPVIPFLHGLALGHPLQVRVLIPFVVDRVPLASPHANLHLAMCVVGGSIDQENPPRTFFRHDVTFPEITVDQNRFDGAAA